MISWNHRDLHRSSEPSSNQLNFQPQTDISDWPERSIRVLRHVSQGVGSDFLMFKICTELMKTLHQRIEFETPATQPWTNRSTRVLSDGYTFTHIDVSQLQYLPLTKMSTYFAPDTFSIPVARGVSTYPLLVARIDSKINSIKDLKKAGIGSLLGQYQSHAWRFGALAGSYDQVHAVAVAQAIDREFEFHSDARMTPMLSLLDGLVDLVFLYPHEVLDLVHAKRVKVIATLDPAGNPAFASVPSLMAAINGPKPLPAWSGLFAPRGTSPQIISRLRSRVNLALTAPHFQSWAHSLGYDAKPMLGHALHLFIAEQRAKVKMFVSQTGTSWF
jgi:tripartite-type tricarboxylate transporter receptor subunit TctC